MLMFLALCLLGSLVNYSLPNRIMIQVLGTEDEAVVDGGGQGQEAPQQAETPPLVLLR